MHFKIPWCCLDIWHKFSLTVVLWPTPHPILIFTGTSAGNARRRLCPLHQLVPRLRAANADGAQISLFLHPRNHGRVQRSVTLAPALCYIPKIISFSLFLTPDYWSVSLNWSLFCNVCFVCKSCVQRCPELEMSCRGLPPLWTCTMRWRRCLWSHLLVSEPFSQQTCSSM